MLLALLILILESFKIPEVNIYIEQKHQDVNGGELLLGPHSLSQVDISCKPV